MSKPFRFKQFSVQHDRCTMKVGTDAVLLGAWVDVSDVQDALDIGTGSGVIALMLAQRTQASAKIDAIEIEQQDAEQAKENAAHSPWPTKVKVHHQSLQAFHPEKKFDLIVSNPPFFQNSLLPPSSKRQSARHTQLLTHSGLLAGVKRLLNSQGTFAIILPTTEGNSFLELAEKNSLFLKRQLAFYSRKEKPQERWLFEMTFTKVQPEKGELILYKNMEVWSDMYRSLTHDFYLDK